MENAALSGTGGALHISGNNLSVLISKSLFRDNMVQIGSAGAIYVEEFSLNLSLIDSTFTDNTAAFCGALEVEGSEHIIKYHQKCLLLQSRGYPSAASF